MLSIETMLQRKVAPRTCALERPKKYQPAQRKFVYYQTIRSETADSPYLSNSASKETRNLSYCLRVTQKDILPNRPEKAKVEDKVKAIKIPCETPKTITASKITCRSTPHSSTDNQITCASINLNLSRVNDKATELQKDEKAQSSRSCAIVRASSCGFLQVNANNTSTKERQDERLEESRRKENVARAEAQCRDKLKGPVGCFLARNRLAHSHERTGVNSFLPTPAARRKTGLSVTPGSASLKANSIFQNVNLRRRGNITSGNPRIKQNGAVSTWLTKQRNMQSENSRSKSSAGHHVVSTDVQVSRQTKSAR